MPPNRVMIVDDDKIFLDELEELLSLSDYEVISVNDPLQAFSNARSTRPDVILLDIKMRGMDGFQVTEKLKLCPETSCIPIIAMTGCFTKKEHPRLMYMCDIRACLVKPFTPLEIISEIESVLSEAKKARK